MPVPLPHRRCPGAPGAAQLELVLAAMAGAVLGSWCGGVAPALGRESRLPSPAPQSGAGAARGAVAMLGLASVQPVRSAESRGCRDSWGSQSLHWRIPSSQPFLPRSWTALHHKLKGNVLKEALIKS